jgi:hypothetical protein
MIVEYKFLPSVLPDNDRNYFSLLQGVIDGVDFEATMCVVHSPGKYHFRIVPSNSNYINPIIHELNALNNLIGIQLEFSKSMKSTSTLVFTLSI